VMHDLMNLALKAERERRAVGNDRHHVERDWRMESEGADCGLRILDCGLRIANCGFSGTDCRLLTSDL
jgi:hypothetical protein